MKSLNSKTDISIFINLRYLQLKLLKNKENNNKICHIFITSTLSVFEFKLFIYGLRWYINYCRKKKGDALVRS